MLTIEGLHAFYGNIHALKGINITLDQGEIITLLGANGAGKTTTLMSISGMISSTSGNILFETTNIIDAKPQEIVSMGISHVPEGRRIFPDFTVLENLEMGAFLRKDKTNIQQDLEYIYHLFPILQTRKKQLGGTLSGGEQQMLAISRALMSRPRLLLLDEPSLGLAPKIVQQIFKILQQINQEQNTTIFLVEQNANLALKIAHRGYVMENGTILFDDIAEKLLHNEKVKEAYLGIIS